MLPASALVLAAAVLAGCAMGDARSSAFVDPSLYDLYDCRQLEAARQPVADRILELRALMAKAETGAAGSLVSGVAYRSDLASTQAKLDLLDQTWRQNNCDTSAPVSVHPDIRSAPVPRGHGGGR